MSLSAWARINGGNLLTFISITGSAFSVIWSWNQDRELKIRESANRIRIEAATLTGKISRAYAVYISFYDEVQSDIIEVSEIMNKSRDIIETRDLMWKRLYVKRCEIQKRILEENLESTYTGLLPFDDKIDSLFNQALFRMKSLHDTNFKSLLRETNDAINAFDPAKGANTAILGNELRGIALKCRISHDVDFKTGTQPLLRHLNELIQAPDNVILGY